MRLTPNQTLSILQTVGRWANKGTTVYLFGSRLDDQARGGDVDLLLETDEPLTLIERAQIKMELETELGLPVDVVGLIRGETPTPFQTLARVQGQRLEMLA